MKTCDSCGNSVRAEWVAYKAKGTLYFCHHHKKELTQALLKQDWKIVGREQLEEMKR